MEKQTINIKTLADIVEKVPLSKLDNFLEDLRAYIIYSKDLTENLFEDLPEDIKNAMKNASTM
ncbi:MAG: hypothetical protein ACTSO7_03745 [Candidatus Heimdallarchaeota archaeon]